VGSLRAFSCAGSPGKEREAAMSARALWYASVKVWVSKYVVRIFPRDRTGPYFREDAPRIEDVERLLSVLRPRWGTDLTIDKGSGIARAVYGDAPGQDTEKVIKWGIEKVTGSEGFAAFILQNYDYESLDEIVTPWRDGLGAAGRGIVGANTRSSRA
jgi:hypothetical protein